MAAVLFVVVAVMWLASFLPGAPTASWWGAVVVPVFLAMFPLWGLTILDLLRRQGAPPRSGTLRVPLRGWRAGVLGVVAAVAFASFVATFLGVGGSRVVDTDAATTEIEGSRSSPTAEESDLTAAAESRLMTSVVMIFTATAALYLTMPEDEVDAAAARPVLAPELPPPARSRSAWGGAIRQAIGRRSVALDVPGTPEEVLARLGTAAPVREVSRSGITGITVQAIWVEPPRRLSRGLELRLDGTISPDGSRGARVDLTVEPVRRWMAAVAVMSTIWTMVIMWFGAMILAAAVPLMAVPWVGFGLFAAYSNLTVARRPSAAAMARVEAAARAGGSGGDDVSGLGPWSPPGR